MADRLRSRGEHEKISMLTVPVSGHVCRTACDSARINTLVRPVPGKLWEMDCTTVAPALVSASANAAATVSEDSVDIRRQSLKSTEYRTG